MVLTLYYHFLHLICYFSIFAPQTNKIIMRKLFYFTLSMAMFFVLSACSSDDNAQESITVETGGDQQQVQNTWVKLSAITADGTPKPNYIVMMFDRPVVLNQPMPAPIKQVVTNAAGLATFELNDIVQGSATTTYYFEAFIEQNGNYVMKSITHPQYNISRGQMITSLILVN